MTNLFRRIQNLWKLSNLEVSNEDVVKELKNKTSWIEKAQIIKREDNIETFLKS